MAFRVVWTNQYNQDLGLIHSINGNHLESPNKGSSIDHQVTIHLHSQNITMLPTNETWADAAADYFVEEPVEETETEAGELSADEAKSIKDILMTIPVDVPLPSVGVEITRITLGKDIKITEVDERTWYLASLPRIRVDDKGKKPLMEKDPVKGNPVKEQVFLILADIEFLVQLREKIIDDVDRFLNSFSFKKLASLKVEDISVKDELVLTWGEAESIRVALNRRMYILTKYIELLIRKFLEARKINFTPGDGASVVDLKVLDKLSDIHSFLLEELKEQAKAHDLTWKTTCCSKFFEGRPLDRGAVIARTNTNTPSKCWIRTMIFVDGVWVVEPCSDHWVKIPKPIVHNEVPRQLSCEDTLPAVSTFFKLMKKRWADVCLAVCEFFVSGKLLPVGSINFCRSLEIVEPFSCFVSRQPTILSHRLSQFCTVSVQYSLFNGLSIADIRSFVSSIVFERTALRDVQRSSVSVATQNVQLAFSSVVEDEDNQMDIDQRLASPTTTADSSMNFSDNDILLGDDAIPNQPSLPTVATNLSTYLDDFRTLLWQPLDAQSEILGILEFRALNAKVTSLDEQVAATRNDLLEFSAQAQETLNHITDQLSELIAYINSGGNDKRGEVSSSRPQPPPDDQNRGSGNTGGGSGARTTDIVERFSGSMSREGQGRGVVTGVDLRKKTLQQ
ncbi:hypothetical protein F511_30754 [Dorcoceras hygrometricum]|uniref:Uncharacterized protein n=1 Tax=Dorcoceras hygrometricum TaxID=472368 RepID=A0A2Z7BHB9_9LAMI|nr:hypothetical protein F511_30754 [Dorcoceras hygrometricum]